MILTVQERKIPAHRVVLLQPFIFFNLKFTTNMLESKSFQVELKDAKPDITEQLVEFTYTARISENSNDVQSLLDAANPSTLAWKIPWTEGPGRLQSMGSLGVGHD